MALAESTQHIDWGCSFTEKGCKISEELCCCTSCFRDYGFLISGANSQGRLDNLLEIEPLFQDKLGFWREGVGCILPREYRSIACLTHHCEDEFFGEAILLLRAQLETCIYKNGHETHIEDKETK